MKPRLKQNIHSNINDDDPGHHCGLRTTLVRLQQRDALHKIDAGARLGGPTTYLPRKLRQTVQAQCSVQSRSCDLMENKNELSIIISSHFTNDIYLSKSGRSTIPKTESI